MTAGCECPAGIEGSDVACAVEPRQGLRVGHLSREGVSGAATAAALVTRVVMAVAVKAEARAVEVGGGVGAAGRQPAWQPPERRRRRRR